MTPVHCQLPPWLYSVFNSADLAPAVFLLPFQEDYVAFPCAVAGLSMWDHLLCFLFLNSEERKWDSLSRLEPITIVCMEMSRLQFAFPDWLQAGTLGCICKCTELFLHFPLKLKLWQFFLFSAFIYYFFRKLKYGHWANIL